MSEVGAVGAIATRRLGRGAFVRVAPGDDAIDELLVVLAPRWRSTALLLRDDADTRMDLLMDLFAIDAGADVVENRYVINAVLRSSSLGYRCVLQCSVAAHEPSLDSLVPVHASANWLERELYDMHGVGADGHPQMRPLLLYTGFVGHPLRRDYRATKSQPLVPSIDNARVPHVIGEDAETP